MFTVDAQEKTTKGIKNARKTNRNGIDVKRRKCFAKRGFWSSAIGKINLLKCLVENSKS